MSNSKTRIIDNIFLNVNAETIEIEINQESYSQLSWREAIKLISDKFYPYVTNKRRFGDDGTIFSYSHPGYWNRVSSSNLV